jgi:hypothetical protein
MPGDFHGTSRPQPTVGVPACRFFSAFLACSESSESNLVASSFRHVAEPLQERRPRIMHGRTVSTGNRGRRVSFGVDAAELTRRGRSANAAECTAWVQTTLAFDLEMRSSDDTAETKPYTVDTFREHDGAVEPTLYLTPSRKWFGRVFSHERPSLEPSPLFLSLTTDAPTCIVHLHNCAAEYFYCLGLEWLARLCKCKPSYTLASL